MNETFTVHIVKNGDLLYAVPNCYVNNLGIPIFVGKSGKEHPFFSRASIEAAGLDFKQFGHDFLAGHTTLESASIHCLKLGTNPDGHELRKENAPE